MLLPLEFDTDEAIHRLECSISAGFVFQKLKM
jgi:hypothetical protein